MKIFTTFFAAFLTTLSVASCRSSDPYEWAESYPLLKDTPYYARSAHADDREPEPVCKKIVTEVTLKKTFSKQDYKLEIVFSKPDTVEVTGYRLPENVKAFQVSGTRTRVTTGLFAKGDDYPDDPKARAKIIINDMFNVFSDIGEYNGLRGSTTESIKDTYLITETYGEKWQEERVYAGNDLPLVEKNYKHDNGARWYTRYYEYRNVEGQGFRPVKIVYDNREEGYTLIFR